VAAPTSASALARVFGEELASERDLRWRLQGLKGGSAAYFLGRLLGSSERPALVIVANARVAENLAVELRTVFGERLDEGFLARRIHLFPESETPPLEMVSPPVEVETGRSAALYQIAQMRAPLVIASVDALALRTPSRQRLLASALHLIKDQEIDLDELLAKMTALGYRKTGLVEEPGELAVRGGIVDFWPAGSEYPSRCELFGDTLESLRSFDPTDQRSFAETDEIVVLSVAGCTLQELGEQRVRNAVHARCGDLMLAASERRQLDGLLAEGKRFPGVELLSCYVDRGREWFGDYLPANAISVVVDPPAVETAIEDGEALLTEAEKAAISAGAFFPEVERLHVAGPELRGLLSRRPLIELDLTEAIESSGSPGNRNWRVEVRGNQCIVTARARVKAARGDRRFSPMVAELEALRKNSRLVVMATDPTQLERLRHLLELGGVSGVVHGDGLDQALAGDARKLWLVQGHFDEGFALPDDRLVVVTDEEIFGERRRSARRRVSKRRALSTLSELSPGDYMVHVDHGVGRYHGLRHMVAGGTEGDFIHLEYAGGDRYYLPVDRINLVEKYTGGGGSAPALAKLGSAVWARTKKRAKASIMELARELLDVEAFRAVHTREALPRPEADFEEFEAHFPFEETEGQKSAIADVVADLSGSKPMDRLVCGDVGYGKTEVAMRAAYLSALGGRQVAFLVPTTVLARQHLDSLIQRFRGFPVDIAMLSRFNSREDNQLVVERLASGGVDIVVGTHRLLQRDVKFARLGLLVIDEEHRFGVKAKERIKRHRQHVDVLTMTATPIPRTLQLALSGVRDLSLIETPPVDRLAIRTYVARYDEGLIKQAIERELTRGGQVFFVHNRVASIEAVARRIIELAPKARVAVAHGQMRETQLDTVMGRFLAGEVDVLVCTSIIESGLDIPNANTILVNRADSFGLAQLYQIRGRVGRSHRRAFAYLLVPGEQLISGEARKRLVVLQELDDLGSGFRIAAHDMEIRGAGNLLGKQQSGHVTAVGFDLFMQMLDEAARELRGQPPRTQVEPEIELGSEAFIPDSYIPDVGERLLVYKRLANAGSHDALAALSEELRDRFGGLPQPVSDFVRVMGLRSLLQRLTIESLTASRGNVALRFHADSPVDPNVLVALASAQPERFGLRPGGVFRMALGQVSWQELVDVVEQFLLDLVSKLGLDDEGGDYAGAALGVGGNSEEDSVGVV